VRNRVLAAAALLGLAGCGSDDGPCGVPVGCLDAQRVDGQCGCVEWETVSTEGVPLPFVLQGASYSPVGNASVLRFGFTSDTSMEPQSASSPGVTIRAVIRGEDRAERVARIGSTDDGLGVRALSASALRIHTGGVWTHTTGVDLPSVDADWISAWVNPGLTLRTNFLGEKIVDWSLADCCADPPLGCSPIPGLACNGPQWTGFSARLLRGEVFWTDWHEAYLPAIGTERRAELLSFVPRQVGGGVAYPRYEHLGDVAVDGRIRPFDATWRPCAEPGEFQVLFETVVPLASGDTFVLQYGNPVDDVCTPQRPGVLLGTTTPGCSVQTRIFVDRLSGELLMEPSAAASTCSTGP
jgi:hypothetical protein